MDWLDLLAVQGTLKSLLQHHSSKASILQCSAFFIVQLSHPYTATGKTMTLTRWTFVGQVMSLLFKMLSRFVITFLPRSKHLLISWLQSPSAVILEPKRYSLCFRCFSIHLPWSVGTGCHDLSFLNDKTSSPPQSVSPIRKLPQASYPSPSEGRQTENHNHRKPTSLITWTTALSNSMKLWAMPCGATQDRRVMV